MKLVSVHLMTYVNAYWVCEHLDTGHLLNYEIRNVEVREKTTRQKS